MSWIERPVIERALMRLTDFKVLSFGCYGTLIDRDSGIWTALRPLLASGQIRLPRSEVLAAFGRHELTLAARSPELPYCELLAQAHHSLAKEWGLLSSDAEHTLFGRSVPKWPAFAEVPAALQYFKRYFRIAVLTNGDRDSFAASARRLEVRFDVVCTAEEARAHMPDPRNVRLLLERLAALGYATGEILHIGASPQRDLAPTKDIGLATAWIDRRSTDTDADKVAPLGGTPFGPRFASVADLVRAHQEELRA